jgi:hypothetical protein
VVSPSNHELRSANLLMGAAMKTTIARFAFLFLAACATSPLHAQTATAPAAQSTSKENPPMTHQSVIDFLNNFEAVAQKKNFDLVADMVHERAIFRFNDGDFVGRAAVRAAFEKTWASSSGKPEQEKFYLSDIVIVATDTNSALRPTTGIGKACRKASRFAFRGAARACSCAKASAGKSFTSI